MSEKKKCPITHGWQPYDPEFRKDPFPTYKEFRQQCPVGRVEAHDGFWAVSRYEDVFEVARDAETFCSGQGIAIPPMEYDGRALPMEADAPEHFGLRQILAHELTPRAVMAREEMLRVSAQKLLAKIADKDEVDISEEYAKLLPTTVICQLLDIEGDEAQLQELQEWTEEIVYERKDHNSARQASDNIVAFFNELIPQRRENLGDDFISTLLKAEVNGQPLSDQDIMDFCWFLLIAGLDNTAFTIRNLLLQISNSEELRQELIADPDKISDAIEEVLRLYSPVWGIARTATKDTEINGQAIAAGDKVMMLFASADRDEEEFPEPDKFVLGRTPNRHMAFGMGAHRCLGSHLARLEIKVAVEEFLQLFPDYQVVGDVDWNTMGPLPIALSATAESTATA
ncbi:cytochrome P450 [Pseudomaricurvus alkylphenolicus]|uniref:cytochrome P450 n=1 Tax=Pseudomaricurvus alkylphenolicus TaxID=1306991 RepID=UPI00142408B2|nr:cytochrome P450 [Pseudomaricurvus alkylphenolicus]NIB44896.1 cytochrome P450 [Pseudomaricurvus alkylphenolicus]